MYSILCSHNNALLEYIKSRYTTYIGDIHLHLLPTILGNLEMLWGVANKVPECRMWPVSRAVSNQALQAVPTSCVPNVWQEGGMNTVPALVCLAARHFSLSNQTVRLEWDPYSCLFPSSPEALSPSHEKHRRNLVCTSFPPAKPQASSVHCYTYLDTITMEQMVQCSLIVFGCCCCSCVHAPCVLFIFLPRQNHRPNEHASVCFISISSVRGRRVFLWICFSGMCEEKTLSVCVWLYWTWWGMILWWLLRALRLGDEEGPHLSHTHLV